MRRQFRNRATLLVDNAKSKMASDPRKPAAGGSTIGTPTNFTHKKAEVGGGSAGQSMTAVQTTTEDPRSFKRSSTAPGPIVRDGPRPQRKSTLNITPLIKKEKAEADVIPKQSDAMRLASMVSYLEQCIRDSQVALYWLSKELPPDLRSHIFHIDAIVRIQRWYRACRAKRQKMTRAPHLLEFVPIENKVRKLPLLLLDWAEMSAQQKAHCRRYTAAVAAVEYEADFYNHLDLLRRYFMQPLREEAVYSKDGFITEGEVDKLFSFVESSRKVSGNLVSRLKSRTKEIQESMGSGTTANEWLIGDVFAANLDSFAIYESYFICLEDIEGVWNRLREKTEMLDFLQVAVAKMQRSYSRLQCEQLFESLLYLPDHHLKGYTAVLDNVLSVTPASHADVEYLRQVRNGLVELGEAIAERVRIAKSERLVQRLQDCITGDVQLAKPGRILVKEGQVQLVEYRTSEGKLLINPRSANDEVSVCKAHLALFNDAIFVGIYEGKSRITLGLREEKITPRKIVRVVDIVSCSIPSLARHKTLAENTEDWAFVNGLETGFIFVTQTELFRFQPGSLDLCQTWVQAIEETIPTGSRPDDASLFEAIMDTLTGSESCDCRIEGIQQECVATSGSPCMLSVQVLEARNLLCPAVFWVQPMVHAKISFGKSVKSTSNVEKGSHIVWGETFKFHVKDPQSQYIKVELYMVDFNNEDEEPAKLGVLSFPVGQLQLATDYCDWIPFKHPLHKRSTDTVQMSIRLSLSAKPFGGDSVKSMKGTVESAQANAKIRKAHTLKDLQKIMGTISNETCGNLLPPHLMNRVESVHRVLYAVMDPVVHAQGSGMGRAVRTPKGVDVHEWQLVNMGLVYELVNQIFLGIKSSCNPDDCPVMSASPSIHYKWADGEEVLTPIEVSPDAYVNYLNAWTRRKLQSKALFPGKGPFPKQDFHKILSTMAKKYFRILSHAYYHHWAQVKDRFGQHFMTCFAFIYLFVTKHKLLNRDTESTTLSPMESLTKQIKHL